MFPPDNRTPKVKAFVQAPFIKCPECGVDECFGVLMICARHFVRRCVNCWFDKSFPLPPLQKKVIYLDQFVISNMTKELDPDRSDAKKHQLDDFYRNLFEKLDRLSKLQLIVCPYSTVHHFESVVVSQYEKLRKVFRHLSHGVSFQDPETIQHAEILSAFYAWRKNNPFISDIGKDFALTRNPDEWQKRFRVELNYDVPGLAAELKATSGNMTAGLHDVCQQWKNDPSFSFEQTFAKEMEAQGNSMIAECMHYAARLAAVQMGVMSVAEVCFPSSAVSTVSGMMRDLAADHLGVEKQLATIQTFFASDQFQMVSSCRIASLFWATIARDVHAGRQPDKFPKAGMFNDIAAVAAYSPFL